MIPLMMAIPGIASAIGKVFGGASKASAENDAAKQRNTFDWNDQRQRQYQLGQNAQIDAGRLDLDRHRYETDATATQNEQGLNRWGKQQGAQMDLGQLDVDRGRLGLEREKFDSSASASALKQALVASLLGGMKQTEFSMPGVPKLQMNEGGNGLLAALQNNPALQEMIANRHKPQARPEFQGGQILDAPELQELGPNRPYVGGGVLAMPNLTDPTKMRTGGNGILNALGMIGSAIGGVGRSQQQQQRNYSFEPLDQGTLDRVADRLNRARELGV